MPQYTCPNGHAWDGPPAPGDSLTCPVCGAATESFSYPEMKTPGTGLPGRNPEMTPELRAAFAPHKNEGDESPPQIPGYAILDELGRGGMGVVYKARQAATGQFVALKVIRKDRLANPESVRRFRREAQAAARLAHPNIVLVYDSDQAGDTHFLAMEYVEGVTLQRLVEQSGPLPVAKACDYVRQAALGLQHAHEQALVHRDVKPANVMVVPGHATPPMDLVKILDMGVARLYQLPESPEELLSTLTQDGAMLGTPDYVAPEQLENAHDADIRADLYSLGCTFHFLLTGDVPFPGGSLIQKLDKQRWAAPAPVNQLRDDVPAGLATVVNKLMAKRPADRYQTPAELVRDLDEALAGRYLDAPRSVVVRGGRVLFGHTAGVHCVAVAADGKHAVSGGKDRTLRLWDLAAGRMVRIIAELPQEVRGAAVVVDGWHVFAASGATARLWDMRTGQEVTRCVGHTDTIKGVALSPDGTRALTGGDDKILRVWDMPSGHEVRRLIGHKRDVTCVAFAPDGRFAVSGSRDQTLRLWDLPTGRELRRMDAQAGLILSVALSSDGRLALTGNFDTTLRLWDAHTGRELRRFGGHKQMVSAAAFSADGRRVLSASHDGTLKLWDTDSAREVCSCEGHEGAVTCAVLLPDGRGAFSGGADGTLRLWAFPESV